MDVWNRVVPLSLVAAVFALTACTAHQKPVEYPPSVPGGAAIVVAPGSPPVCSALAASPSLRMVSLALDKMTADDPDGAAQLRNAAKDARSIAGSAGENWLAVDLDAFADALDQLASSGLADTDGISRFRSSMLTVSEEVQALCHFPVG